MARYTDVVLSYTATKERTNAVMFLVPYVHILLYVDRHSRLIEPRKPLVMYYV